MSYIKVKKSKPFDLEIDDIAPDKSISHRAAMCRRHKFQQYRLG